MLGPNVASFLRAAADQTGLMALAEGKNRRHHWKDINTSGERTLKERSGNLHCLAHFPQQSAQIYFTMSQTISRSGCSARVISRRVWMRV